tara:strand:- start:13 stop:288 length:276 start_codon:yes stop_codon:yes gene_type:complete
MVMGPIYQSLVKKIEQNLSPVSYRVKDESHKHEGHAGHDGHGESHFRVEIVSPIFENMSRIDRQRRVYSLFKEELDSRIHALSLKLKSPNE